MRALYRKIFVGRGKKSDRAPSPMPKKSWLRHKILPIVLMASFSLFPSCKNSKPEPDRVDSRRALSLVEKTKIDKTAKPECSIKVDAGKRRSTAHKKEDSALEKIHMGAAGVRCKMPTDKHAIGTPSHEFTEQETKRINRIFEKVCNVTPEEAIKIYRKGLSDRSPWVRLEVEGQLHHLAINRKLKPRMQRKVLHLFEKLLHDRAQFVRANSLWDLKDIVTKRIPEERDQLLREEIYTFGRVYISWTDRAMRTNYPGCDFEESYWHFVSCAEPETALQHLSLRFFAENLGVDLLNPFYGVREVTDARLMGFAISVFQRGLAMNSLLENLLSVIGLANLARDKKTNPATKKKIERILVSAASSFLRRECHNHDPYTSYVRPVKLITEYFEKMRKAN